jgi:hypothetical protein
MNLKIYQNLVKNCLGLLVPLLQIIVAGGRDFWSALESVEVFDVESQKWIKGPGVNFTNVLLKAFMPTDPKIVKI